MLPHFWVLEHFRTHFEGVISDRKDGNFGGKFEIARWHLLPGNPDKRHLVIQICRHFWSFRSEIRVSSFKRNVSFFCQNLCPGAPEGSENGPILLEIQFYICSAQNPESAHQVSGAVSEGAWFVQLWFRQSVITRPQHFLIILRKNWVNITSSSLLRASYIGFHGCGNSHTSPTPRPGQRREDHTTY